MSVIKTNNNNKVYTIDLNFMGLRGAIAAYLVPHKSGAILVECGPGTTIENLHAGIKTHGFGFSDISDVLLTHIHLDHAGAAGWLAQSGVRIHVHPVGAPHLLDPQKLLASAERIYGDMMGTLWGEFLPTPAEKLFTPQDGEMIEIEGLRFNVLDTPGHANHHYAYIFEGICFSGDIGGVRITETSHLRLPMPPPEFHLETWRASLERLQDEYKRDAIQKIAPTHFGIYDNPGRHLSALRKALDDVEDWMRRVMPNEPSIEELREQFVDWTRQQSVKAGIASSVIDTYELANPSWMSAYGIQRYWRKYHQPQEN